MAVTFSFGHKLLEAAATTAAMHSTSSSVPSSSLPRPRPSFRRYSVEESCLAAQTKAKELDIFWWKEM